MAADAQLQSWARINVHFKMPPSRADKQAVDGASDDEVNPVDCRAAFDNTFYTVVALQTSGSWAKAEPRAAQQKASMRVHLAHVMSATLMVDKVSHLHGLQQEHAAAAHGACLKLVAMKSAVQEAWETVDDAGPSTALPAQSPQVPATARQPSTCRRSVSCQLTSCLQPVSPAGSSAVICTSRNSEQPCWNAGCLQASQGSPQGSSPEASSKGSPQVSSQGSCPGHASGWGQMSPLPSLPEAAKCPRYMRDQQGTACGRNQPQDRPQQVCSKVTLLECCSRSVKESKALTQAAGSLRGPAVFSSQPVLG